jgi:hypothetical protein
VKFFLSRERLHLADSRLSYTLDFCFLKGCFARDSGL